MEYEDGPAPLNPSIADVDNDNNDEKSGKQRRYWNTKEEERFFEIWGRDNWKLTKHGKNTLHFAEWSLELKERFDIDVKPEEIQAKVNQTRAKYRQVKKQMEKDDVKKDSRWKKFDILTQILSNQFRTKDAEPIPPEALENNRDFVKKRKSSGSPPLTNSGDTSKTNGDDAAPVEIKTEINMFDNSNTSNYNTELFTDPDDTLKRTYDDYSYPYNTQPSYTNETGSPQLHQLQTPQQQQQMYTTPYNAPSNEQLTHPQQHLDAHIQQLQQQQALVNSGVQNSFAGTTYGSQPYTNNNNNNFAGTNDVNNMNNNNMLPPPRTVQIRKRRQSVAVTAVVDKGSNESFESLYMAEVKKRNEIMSDTRDIQQKIMVLENRKVELLSEYLPRLCEMAEKMVEKIFK